LCRRGLCLGTIPGLVSTYRCLALAHFNMGNYQKSIKYYEAALRCLGERESFAAERRWKLEKDLAEARSAAERSADGDGGEDSAERCEAGSIRDDCCLSGSQRGQQSDCAMEGASAAEHPIRTLSIMSHVDGSSFISYPSYHRMPR